MAKTTLKTSNNKTGTANAPRQPATDTAVPIRPVKQPKSGAKKPGKLSKKQEEAARLKNNFAAARAKAAAKVKSKKHQEVGQAKPEIQENPKITRPTPAEEILIIKRRNLVFDLRGRKASFRHISNHLETLKDKETSELVFAGIVGTSPATCFEDYQHMLSLQYAGQRLTVEQYTEEELNTLDGVEFDAQRNYARTGEKEYGDLIISCVRERAKLRNLYKPVKIELNIEQLLSDLTGVPIEELPADDDEIAE